MQAVTMISYLVQKRQTLQPSKSHAGCPQNWTGSPKLPIAADADCQAVKDWEIRLELGRKLPPPAFPGLESSLQAAGRESVSTTLPSHGLCMQHYHSVRQDAPMGAAMAVCEETASHSDWNVGPLLRRGFMLGTVNPSKAQGRGWGVGGWGHRPNRQDVLWSRLLNNHLHTTGLSVLVGEASFCSGPERLQRPQRLKPGD